MQVGGSPSRIEKAHAVLQRMVGRNGYAESDDEIEALWRLAKADAMAAIESFDERAALQASPATASDHIPLYEEALGLPIDETLSDQQRREIVTPDYTGVPEAWTSGLLEALQRIEPTVTIRNRAWENSGACQIGRWYEPFAPAADEIYDDGGNRKATSWPNASDVHSVVVEYDIGSGVVPNNDQLRKKAQIQDHLNDVCPAWVTHHVVYSVGFALDISRLDATSFDT